MLGKLKKKLKELSEDANKDMNDKDTSHKIIPRKLMKAKVKSFNDELNQLGKKKLLTQAIKLYNTKLRQGLELDVHSYGNLLNICVRCGEMSKAEVYFQAMQEKNIQVNVIIFTTMLKGYCDVGLMSSAYELYDSRLLRYPNVEINTRTINTILRGCKRIGEVDIAKEIFDSVISVETEFGLLLDISSYEYVVSLLSQALHFNSINEVLSQLKSHVLPSDPVMNPIYLSLARAFTIVDNESAQDFIARVKENGFELDNSNVKSINMFLNHRLNEFELLYDQMNEYWNRRDYSILSSFKKILYLLDCTSRLLYFGFDGKGDLISYDKRNSSDLLNEDSCVGDSKNSEKLIPKRLALVLAEKFGLNSIELSSTIGVNSDICDLKTLRKDIKVFRKQVQSKVLNIFDQNTGKIDFEKLFKKVDGKTKKERAIQPELLTECRIFLEIGSGTGDWIISQALANQTVDEVETADSGINAKRKLVNEISPCEWIAMELKCDRVYDMFSKACFKQVSNLSIIGGNAAVIIPNYIPPCSVDKIFINFPEPPERTSGIYDSQGSHLLTNTFFKDIHSILKSSSSSTNSSSVTADDAVGTITIVSDNLIYIKSIANELSKQALAVTKSYYDLQVDHHNLVNASAFESVVLDYSGVYNNINTLDHIFHIFPENFIMHSYNEDEVDTDDSIKPKKAKVIANNSNVHARRIELWRGTPGPEAGHVVNSSSYFDRLWENGNKTDRWFLYLKKLQI